jgi:hypothetical protein
MRRTRVFGYLLATLAFLLLSVRLAEPDGLLLSMGGGGGEGGHVDIFIKELTVSPLNARAGDVIRIDMRWVYWGAISNRDYETTKAEIRANGTVVASIPFVYGYGASLGDEYAHSWFWDTRGFPPGKYGIRGEVFLWRDATPYDNFLALKEPVILLAPGAEFPGGREAGGAGVVRNPSFK